MYLEVAAKGKRNGNSTFIEYFERELGLIPIDYLLAKPFQAELF
jgi:hypothetical protein